MPGRQETAASSAVSKKKETAGRFIFNLKESGLNAARREQKTEVFSKGRVRLL
jgi:hypothetical protein